MPRRRANADRDRYHHGDLRRALIDAGLSLVDERGVAGLTLREIARRAGVTQTAPYRHFPDKAALLAEVAAEGFRALHERMATARDVADGPLEGLRDIGIAYVEFAVAHPAHFRIMFSRELVGADASQGALREAGEAAFALLVQALADCQAAGLARPGEPESLALAAWSAVHGLSALLIERRIPPGAGGQPPRVADLARSLTEIFRTGLQPRNP